MHIVKDQDAGTNIITVRGTGTNRNLAASAAFAQANLCAPQLKAEAHGAADLLAQAMQEQGMPDALPPDVMHAIVDRAARMGETGLEILWQLKRSGGM